MLLLSRPIELTLVLPFTPDLVPDVGARRFSRTHCDKPIFAVGIEALDTLVETIETCYRSVDENHVPFDRIQVLEHFETQIKKNSSSYTEDQKGVGRKQKRNGHEAMMLDQTSVHDENNNDEDDKTDNMDEEQEHSDLQAERLFKEGLILLKSPIQVCVHIYIYGSLISIV